jgi:hypothetical protein
VAKQVRADTFGRVLRVSDVSTASALHKAKSKRNAVQAVGTKRHITQPTPPPANSNYVAMMK